MTDPPSSTSTPLLRKARTAEMVSQAYTWSVVGSVILVAMLPVVALAHLELSGTPWERWALRAFFAAITWGGLAGVVQTVRRTNPWWLLATLAVIAVPVGITLMVARAVPLTLH